MSPSRSGMRRMTRRATRVMTLRVQPVQQQWPLALPSAEAVLQAPPPGGATALPVVVAPGAAARQQAAVAAALAAAALVAEALAAAAAMVVAATATCSTNEIPRTLCRSWPSSLPCSATQQRHEYHCGGALLHHGCRRFVTSWVGLRGMPSCSPIVTTSASGAMRRRPRCGIWR